jgi:hypothetical protein
MDDFGVYQAVGGYALTRKFPQADALELWDAI